jgi:DNA-binding transcriptional MerR regulator
MSDKNFKGVGKKTLFTIGEMARLFHMNIRTLRYYDEIGILKPEYVNEETNYRYYSTVQFERLNTIKYLRALDVPLEKILIFLNEKEVNTILSIFVEQRERVLKKQEQLSRIEKKITNRMEQIEAALTASYGEVIVKQIPQREIVLFEKKITRQEDLEPLIRDISKKSYLDDAIFLGKVGVSVSQEDLKKGEFTHFSSIFIIVEDEDDFINKDVVLQEGLYATVQYRGTHEEASPYYTMLLDYLMDSGFQIKGDSIEITIIDAGMTNDHNQFVTELQIPISQSQIY